MRLFSKGSAGEKGLYAVIVKKLYTFDCLFGVRPYLTFFTKDNTEQAIACSV